MAVNYISEIRIFYDRQMAQPLSAGQISLWHALMEMNNRHHWQEWFHVKMSALQLMSGLSRGGVSGALEVLIRRGFVEQNAQGMLKLHMQNSQNEGFLHINIIKEKKRNETKDEEVICDDGLQDFGGEARVQFTGGIKL